MRTADSWRPDGSDGMAGRAGLGDSPALLVVDVQRGFTDPRSVLGAAADDMVNAIIELLGAARESDIPIFYTVCVWHEEAENWARKIPAQRTLRAGSEWVQLDSRLAARPTERVIEKHFASAFFGTNVHDLLAERGVDTLIVAGMTTSGCVRASVVDGCSYGYRVVVPREAVADRDTAAHGASMSDMDLKYADVGACHEVIDYLASHERHVGQGAQL